MKEKTIKHLTYRINSIKPGEPKPIVLLGAGCSVSAGIPLASKIVKDVSESHKENPDVELCLSKNQKPSYRDLMECLNPNERRDLFQNYVKNAKINVSHIYLAYLMAKGYVDYILTVNFDDLAQRALALYNVFPPTYDLSILKELTTTTLETRSITYLHGRYDGLWQLNTKEEMEKVIKNNIAKDIFNKITNNRLWIVIGYSGDDFIFDELIKLGRFNNGLFWVSYKDHEPSKNVQDKLLNEPDTESFWIKGYDSDSFFLKLNSELKLDQPRIFDTPFSFLADLQNNITDINSNDEDYKSVKGRLEASKKMVEDAINRYEKQPDDTKEMSDEDIEFTKLEKSLINCLINEDYDDLSRLEDLVNQKEAYSELRSIVASIYYNWGTGLAKLADTRFREDAKSLYDQAFSKFQKTVKIKPDFYNAYYNWGVALSNIAEKELNIEKESLYQQSFEKFGKVIELKPDKYEAYYNWGNHLAKLSDIKSGEEAELLLHQAFEKYQKSVEIKHDYHEAYYNWGTYLSKLADIKSGKESESLYYQGFEKFQKSTIIKPNKYEAFTNWGIALSNLARKKSSKEASILYHQALEKYQKSVEIKPNFHETYYNWGTTLGKFAKTKSGIEQESLYQQAFEKYQKAVEIKPDQHEAYYNWGTTLGELAEIKSGIEQESLYLQAFEKYQKAAEIKPDQHEAYCNWGNDLLKLAKIKSGAEQESLYQQAFEKLNKAVELGESSYNLACLHAKRNNKDDAFRLLRECLSNQEITFDFVENDDDWNAFREMPEYAELKTQFSKQ